MAVLGVAWNRALVALLIAGFSFSGAACGEETEPQQAAQTAQTSHDVRNGAPAPSEPEEIATEAAAGPALWRVTMGDSTLYLFGTIHLLPPDTEWMTPAVRAAVESADDLWLEIDESEMASPAVQQEVVRLGIYPGSDGLTSRIDDGLESRLGELSAALGVPLSQLEQMRPWLASVTLTLAFAQAQGFSAESGVDKVLSEIFKARGAPVHGLESAATAIAALGELSEAEQIELLRDTVDQLEDAGELLKNMHDDWLEGDVEGLEENLLAELKGVPKLYETLIVRRNAAWLETIDARLRGGGTHFIAVGAGHLLGEDGLTAQLAADGYEVARVAEAVP